MKVSVFKIGLVMIIIGMIWVSVIFNETEKNHNSTLLKESNSIESKLEFSGVGIGYYKIYIPEFSDENVFVQILDRNLNVIQEQKVNTKFSVAYFDVDKDGTYTNRVWRYTFTKNDNTGNYDIIGFIDNDVNFLSKN
jgi:hypothetical protein